ncbi:NYN domain-containing protein [Ruegeria sediminis]|uniref:NYN domain-containing protein n=1 Tax=Ruegeria sediminis TaxID=2583820 RepID=UPI001FE254DF|nr:NYN domain-containing protein [Ruegeria sediminis]
MAVLVDGDNVSADHGNRILEISERYGRIDTARIYFDAQKGNGWHKVVGYRTVHAGTGKNAADLLLAIDAMEIAFTRAFDVFVVASSDGDFSHLVQRLRELGRMTIGIGEAKAPHSIRANCAEFVELGENEPVKPKAVPRPNCSKLDRQIRSVIAIHSKNGAGMKIASLAPKMHQQFGIRISTLPEGTWRAYLLARPALFDLDPKGPEAMVRFKPEGFACSDLLDVS